MKTNRNYAKTTQNLRNMTRSEYNDAYELIKMIVSNDNQEDLEKTMRCVCGI